MTTTTQRAIFNPGLTSGSSAAGGAKSKPDAETNKDYPVTSVSTRVQIRKLIFEAFQADSSAANPAKFSVSDMEFPDPKSKQYRDKSRVVTAKLKGPRFEEVRRQLREGELEAKVFISDDNGTGSAGGARQQTQTQQNPAQRMGGGPPGMQAPTFRPGGPIGGPMVRPRPGGPGAMFRPPMGGIARAPIISQHQTQQQQQQVQQQMTPRSQDQNDNSSQQQEHEKTPPQTQRSQGSNQNRSREATTEDRFRKQSTDYQQQNITGTSQSSQSKSAVRNQRDFNGAPANQNISSNKKSDHSPNNPIGGYQQNNMTELDNRSSEKYGGDVSNRGLADQMVNDPPYQLRQKPPASSQNLPTYSSQANSALQEGGQNMADESEDNFSYNQQQNQLQSQQPHTDRYGAEQSSLDVSEGPSALVMIGDEYGNGDDLSVQKQGTEGKPKGKKKKKKGKGKKSTLNMDFENSADRSYTSNTGVTGPSGNNEEEQPNQSQQQQPEVIHEVEEEFQYPSAVPTVDQDQQFIPSHVIKDPYNPFVGGSSSANENNQAPISDVNTTHNDGLIPTNEDNTLNTDQSNQEPISSEAHFTKDRKRTDEFGIIQDINDAKHHGYDNLNQKQQHEHRQDDQQSHNEDNQSSLLGGGNSNQQDSQQQILNPLIKAEEQKDEQNSKIPSQDLSQLPQLSQLQDEATDQRQNQSQANPDDLVNEPGQQENRLLNVHKKLADLRQNSELFMGGRGNSIQSMTSFMVADSETVKRLQDQIKYMKEQNKELKDRLLLVENDCHLQQRKSNIVMEENKQIREEARKVQREANSRQQIDERQVNESKLAANRMEILLKEKQQEIEQIKRELQRAKEEKDSHKDRYNQVQTEVTQSRVQIEKTIKSLQNRNQGTSQLLNSQNLQSSQQNESAFSNQQDQIEVVQKEMSEIKSHYETMIRDKNNELQTKTKDLQKAERTNQQLQQKNRQLEEYVSQFQIQTLSTVAGSGSNQRDSQSLASHNRRGGRSGAGNEEEYDAGNSSDFQSYFNVGGRNDQSSALFGASGSGGAGGQQLQQHYQPAPRDNATTGAGVDNTGTRQSQQQTATSDALMSAESGSTAFIDRNPYSGSGGVSGGGVDSTLNSRPQSTRQTHQSIQQLPNQVTQASHQTGSNNNHQYQSSSVASNYYQHHPGSAGGHNQSQQYSHDSLAAGEQEIYGGPSGAAVNVTVSGGAAWPRASGGGNSSNRQQYGSNEGAGSSGGNNNQYFGQSTNNEEQKQSSDPTSHQSNPLHSGSNQHNYQGSASHGYGPSSLAEGSSHRANPYYVGGSGEQEEDSSNIGSVGFINPAAGGSRQANVNQRGRNATGGARAEHGIITPSRRNDSKKTSGANTPSKEGAETPPTNIYRGQQQQQQDTYVHNLTSNRLFMSSNQDESEGGGNSGGAGGQMMGGQAAFHSQNQNQQQLRALNQYQNSQPGQQLQADAGVIPTNMFD